MYEVIKHKFSGDEVAKIVPSEKAAIAWKSYYGKGGIRCSYRPVAKPVASYTADPADTSGNMTDGDWARYWAAREGGKCRHSVKG